jgi:hypothetical protein
MSNVAQAAVVLMTSAPELAVATMSSVLAGTPLGDQVPAEFQLPPVFEMVLVAMCFFS